MTRFPVGVELVAGLVAEQYPHWADLALRPVEPRGTDNAMCPSFPRSIATRILRAASRPQAPALRPSVASRRLNPLHERWNTCRLPPPLTGILW